MDDDLVERFWSKVDKRGPEECWEWISARRSGRYGSFRLNGETHRAHRFSASLAGMVIDGLMVRHDCDNPSCVNPAHLRPGTAADNCRDMWERGRQRGISARNAVKTHCDRGHELSGDNLRLTPSGLRACRACHAVHSKDVQARAMAAIRRQREINPRPQAPAYLIRRSTSQLRNALRAALARECECDSHQGHECGVRRRRDDLRQALAAREAKKARQQFATAAEQGGGS